MIKNREDSSCGVHFLRAYNRIYVSQKTKAIIGSTPTRSSGLPTKT